MRNPFERLHSAYADKLNLDSAFFNWRDPSHNKDDPVHNLFNAVRMFDKKEGFTKPEGYFSSFEAFIRVSSRILTFGPKVLDYLGYLYIFNLNTCKNVR